MDVSHTVLEILTHKARKWIVSQSSLVRRHCSGGTSQNFGMKLTLQNYTGMGRMGM